MSMTSCACCFVSADSSGRQALRALPCGHRFCLPCIGARSRLGLGDRSLLPAHCCRKEFPIDFVSQALDSHEFARYELFVSEKHWTTLDLASDSEYAQVAKQNGCTQCPGCGIAVLKTDGCNHVRCFRGHEFCFVCGKVWRTLEGVAPTEMQYNSEQQQQQYAAELARLSQTQTPFTSDAIDEQVADVDIQLVLEEVYALETQREELRRAEQIRLDEAIARSLNDAEVAKLLGHPTVDLSNSDSKVEIVEMADLECKPPPSCTCCLVELADATARRPLPCGHLYCLECIMMRAGMGVRDRNLLPAHCCRKEFPVEYVKEALPAADFEQYERFVKEKHWTTIDLDSDREYAATAKHHGCVQCPGCGVGVQRITGCNRMRCFRGHEFCFDCGKQWKTCPCRYA